MKRKVIMAAVSIALFLITLMLIVSDAWAADSVGEPGRSAGGKNPLVQETPSEQAAEIIRPEGD